MSKLRGRYNSKRANAKQRGIAFNLTFEEYETLSKINRCYYTGTYVRIKDKQEDDTWSLDRIDPNLPYTMSNVVVASHLANRLKNQLIEKSTEEIYALQQMLQKLNLPKPQQIRKKSKWQLIWELIVNK